MLEVHPIVVAIVPVVLANGACTVPRGLASAGAANGVARRIAVLVTEGSGGCARMIAPVWRVSVLPCVQALIQASAPGASKGAEVTHA